MNDKLKVSVLFFRYGKDHYYRFNGNTHKLSTITMNNLKEQLTVPYKIQFYALSRAQVGRVITDLLETSDIDVQVKKLPPSKDKYLQFEATFNRKKKYIDAYLIPDNSLLYGRTNNCKPYLYTEVNSKKILFEVSKDYAKQNEGNYYFLATDLTDNEKEVFDSLYANLEYDYIYGFKRSLENENNNQKKLRKKK